MEGGIWTPAFGLSTNSPNFQKAWFPHKRAARQSVVPKMQRIAEEAAPGRGREAVWEGLAGRDVALQGFEGKPPRANNPLPLPQSFELFFPRSPPFPPPPSATPRV